MKRKKILSLLLVLAMGLSLTACSDEETESGEAASVTEASEAEPEAGRSTGTSVEVIWSPAADLPPVI